MNTLARTTHARHPRPVACPRVIDGDIVTRMHLGLDEVPR
jgi:hypothetical protein